MNRIEFGVGRTNCSCRDCQTNCRFMPGFLIPSDLGRMIPAGSDPMAWAETNLLASPGALVMKSGSGDVFRIPTLVPAIKKDGSCIHLQGSKRNSKCAIHEIAPFGCAFFDCGTEREGLSFEGLMAVYNAGSNSLYYRLWQHLQDGGWRQQAPEVLRKRMALLKR